MASVLVVGNTACDLVDGSPRRAGGAPLYATEAFAALAANGMAVTSVGELDTDLADAVRRHGLPVVVRPVPESATFVLRHDGARRSLEIVHLGPCWSADDVARWVAPALRTRPWIQVGALSRSDFGPDALAALARLGPVALDGQGLTRPGHVGPVLLDEHYDRRVLEHLTVLKLSEDEAEAIGGERAAVALAVPELLVTLGPRGAIVHHDATRTVVETREVRGCDTTGAGDRFLAAYLARRAVGEPPSRAAAGAAELVQALLEAQRPARALR